MPSEQAGHEILDGMKDRMNDCCRSPQNKCVGAKWFLTDGASLKSCTEKRRIHSSQSSLVDRWKERKVITLENQMIIMILL